jgi:acetylornithine deacetylase
MAQSIDLQGSGGRAGVVGDLARLLDERIHAHAEEAFGFLERLVAAPSTVGQEQAALEVFAAELTELGFAVERLPIPEHVAELPGAGVPLRSYDGRYDVVARRPGDLPGAPSLLLNGHIDVVPADEPQLWTTPPFDPSRRDGWLYGRGAGDMKCGFAMGVLALRALLDPDVRAPLGALTFVAAIEEEYTGNGTLASIDAGVLADAVVLLEPTDLDLLLGGVGILWLRIVVHGRAAHAEAAGGAVNAIEAAARLLPSLRAMEDELNDVVDPRIASERPLHVNVGRLHGGDWSSSVPSVARLDVRIGFPATWTAQDAETWVRERLAAAFAADPWLAEHPPEILANGFRAEGYDLPADHPLAQALAAAHRDAHGQAPATVVMASTTDARAYLHHAGRPALCYGPRTVRIHGVDEAVELASIVAGARTLARFLVAHARSGALP